MTWSEDNSPRAAPVAYRILVADDNVDAADSLGMLLRLMGNEVRTVNDGLGAVAEAEAFLPHMVFLDIGMPGLNGHDAARRIREQEWGRGMVLAALTGWGEEDDKRRATEAGFNRHFTKPVNHDDIERFVLEFRPPELSVPG